MGLFDFMKKKEASSEKPAAAVTQAAIRSFKDAFAQIDGQVPAREFIKNINT